MPTGEPWTTAADLDLRASLGFDTDQKPPTSVRGSIRSPILLESDDIGVRNLALHPYQDVLEVDDGENRNAKLLLELANGTALAIGQSLLPVHCDHDANNLSAGIGDLLDGLALGRSARDNVVDDEHPLPR